jgi:hypothetical protein
MTKVKFGLSPDIRRGKGKVTFHPVAGHMGPEGEYLGTRWG